ncbi:MAG: sulfur transferase domain-containing protein [Sandaracinaceae bacterium]
MTRTMTLLAALVLVGCGGASQTDSTGATDSTADSAGGESTYGRQVGPELVVGGQPTDAELRAAAELGVQQVVTLRAASEPGQDGEEALATELGLHFVRIPVAGADGLTEDNARALDAALANGSTLLHCGSGNRAGALLGLRAHVVSGASAEEAMERARAAGMTSLESALEERLTSEASEDEQSGAMKLSSPRVPPR